jgi:hypothetical protein
MAGDKADRLLGRKPASALPRTIRGEVLYQRAMIDALLAELLSKRTVPVDTKTLRVNSLKELEQAYRKGFGRVHPADVWKERAFRKLRDQAEFKSLLGDAFRNLQDESEFKRLVGDLAATDRPADR